jgi:hypothetical protein
MNAPAPVLDGPATEGLCFAIARCVRDHYGVGRRPDSTRVFEVLNALAVNVAVVIDGTGGDPAALEFFRRALADNRREPDKVPHG